jgi:5-methylcytosine-specific restriction enzyme subunit McrC
MPSPHTIFEHEYTSGFNWSDSELGELERLNRAVGTEVLTATVRGSRRELKAGQHVGVLRFGNRTVQVLPKIYSSSAENSEKRIQEATHNLLHMFAYAGQLPVREHSLAPLLRKGNDWFEILTRLFASHLLEEWQRGAFRTYQTVEDELPVLKGKWRISDQMRQPLSHHIFSVAYDEFTADNRLNRIFRFVVERLWRLSRNSQNRQMLGELRQWMEEVKLPSHVTADEADATQLTRINQRFGPLLNLARLFLEGGSLQLTAHDFTSFAFVFDMNQLFEAFIANFLRKHRDEILPPELADCEVLVQTRGANRCLAQWESRPVFQLKPDIAFRMSNQFPVLLDTKYKRLDRTNGKLGIAEADFYQMHAYAHRYKSGRVFLVYPEMAEMGGPMRREFRIEDTEIRVIAATVNLKQELHSGYGRARLIEELRSLLREEEPK